MSEEHWNEADPAEDADFERVEAAPPGQQDEFPADWGTEPTERDQAAIDSGAADEAIYQDLVDAGWTPPPAWASSSPVAADGDPATAHIDAGPPAAVLPGDVPPVGEPMGDDGAGVDYPVPHWD